MSLATPSPEGYAVSGRPIGETVASLVTQFGQGRMPAMVYLRDGRNSPGNAVIEEKLKDENVAIALERFLCLRADLRTLPDQAQREQLKLKLPALLFFDPAGKPVCSLSGRRATSGAALAALVGKLWKLSFTTSQRTYTKQKDDILDRLATIERKREAVMGKASRREGRTAKLVELERDVAEIESLMLAVHADDRELAGSVTLRESYREADTTAAE